MNKMMMGWVLVLGSLAPLADAAQQCNTHVGKTTPNARFEVVVGSQGAEVLDLYTNLVWQRCSIGQQWSASTQNCTGTATTYTWVDALTQAKAVGGDYRLPNIKELHNLREQQCSTPSINTVLFPNTPVADPEPRYWSSSPYAGDDVSAWSMEFVQGTTDVAPKAAALLYVRAVRANAATAPK
jgi:hypothetical protein